MKYTAYFTRQRIALYALLLGSLLTLGGVFAVRVVIPRFQAQNMDSPNNPLAASVNSKVIVPENLRRAPFDVDRFLTLPPGFTISVVARVDQARFLAVTPDGNVLVSQPGAGKIALIQTGATPTVSDFATGLTNPQSMVFHTIGDTTYLYVSESNQIDRYVYRSGETTIGDKQVVVPNLPDASLPELTGAYAHPLKNIAIDSHDKLYIAIGSTCNACIEDTSSEPKRGAIYQYNADGSQGRLFAQGLRNAEGLAILPDDTLWVVVNNRDNIADPSPGSNYGQVFASYVDNHPPDEFTSVRDGGNYGWPVCNPNPDTPSGLDSMPFDRDYELNKDGAIDCAHMDTILKGIQAHSAPLGLTFLQNTSFPEPYRGGAVIALHGSWNRATKTGYKIVYFPWDSATQRPGAQINLVVGWLNNLDQSVWGRPVDSVVDTRGNLLISDDLSGTIYKLSPSTGIQNTAPLVEALRSF